MYIMYYWGEIINAYYSGLQKSPSNKCFWLIELKKLEFLLSEI